MPYKKGESGNPKGRVPGSTPGVKLRKAVELQSDAILKTVIDAALSGDLLACKMLLDRILPVLKPQALEVKLRCDETLTLQGNTILNATLSGQIPPDIGSQLITALAGQARIVEIDDLLERIKLLEARQ